MIRLYSEGNLQEAVALADQLLLDFPATGFLHNIRGASLLGLGEVEAAIESYGRALKLEPNDAKTHFNLGIALAERGDVAAAIDSYRQALSLDANYAPAYNNLGNALKDTGDLTAAIDCYTRVLQLDPNAYEVRNNLGNAYKDKGEHDSAIQCYQQALQINPNYAVAYNNMGSALNEKAELESARRCYEQAFSIDPNYADAAWNRVGTAADAKEAEAWLLRCLDADRDYLSARQQLAVLRLYEGDGSALDALRQSSPPDHPVLRSIEWVAQLPVLPPLYFNRWALFEDMAKRSQPDRPFYEFGVFTGESFRYLIKHIGRGYGFDTFEGLPEDWREEKAGAYSSAGAVPSIAGGEFIAGRFEDTLPGFFAEPRPVAALINFDADLYSSTICALNNARSVIDGSTVLIFDEFFVNDHWEQDEYKALSEFCSANELEFEVLAVSFLTKQVVVKLVGL